MSTMLHTMIVQLIVGQREPETIPPEQWADIAKIARNERVSSQLYYATYQKISDYETATTLARQTFSTVANYKKYRTAMLAINARLNAEEIAPLWLKGVGLANSVYDQPTMRPMIDIDLIVPREKIQRTLQIMLDMGYDHDPPLNERFVSPDDPAIQFWNHHNTMADHKTEVYLEIHNRFLTGYHRYLSLEGEAWLWSQTEMLKINEQRCMILNPEAQLIYLSGHAILHHKERRLITYFDIYQLLSSRSLDWNLLAENALRFDLGWMVAVVLEETSAYFEIEVPTDVLSQLQASQPSHKTLHRIARQHAVKDMRTWQQTLINLSYVPIQNLPHILQAIVFPTPKSMKELYNDSEQPLWRKYLSHWKRLMARLIELFFTKDED